MTRLRQPLTRQIGVRLALALLATIIATASLAVWFYARANQRFLESHVRQAEKHYADALVQREGEWERQAHNFRARLEYSRALEDAASRQGRLGNFITAQGGVPEYPLVLVLDRDGTRLATFEYGLRRIPSVKFAKGGTGWAFDEAANVLYRVFRQPVWLGAERNGTLLVFRPLDHAVLGSMAYPEAELFVFWYDHPVASSLGEDGLKLAVDHLTDFGQPNLQLLSWSPAHPNNPLVLIRVASGRAFAPGELLLPMIFGALVFVVVAWLVFGLWATGLVRRVVALGTAHNEFAGLHELSPAVTQALESVEFDRCDELADVSWSLQGMMSGVAEHERAQQAAAEVLRQSEERYRFLVEGARVVAWEYSTRAERLTYVSSQAVDLLGYELEDWLQPGFVESHTHPDDAAAVMAARATAIARSSGCSLDYRLRHRDGHFVWVHHLSSPASSCDLDGNMAICGILLDINERKASEQRLALAGLVFEKAAEGIMVTDAQNRIISVNPAFETITGHAADEVMGKDPKLLDAGLESAGHYAAMWRGLTRDGFWEGEVWNRRKSGELYAQRISVSVMRDESGEIKRHLALFSDVTMQKRQAEEIEHQAGHDSLTGLPNRRLLGDRMEQAIVRATLDGKRVGVAMVDLDGFKHINDTLGHRVGDLLLIEAGRRLVDCVREFDTVARVGGDEFMLVLPEVLTQNDLRLMAINILERIREPYCIEGKELFVAGSIGLTLFPDDGGNPEILIAHADTAMYRAKAHGRNTYCFFTPEMHHSAVARMHLEDELRRAVRDEEFVLHYQPIIDLATGLPARAEALIRWRHPERGLVDPDEFIPVAEDTGLILSLGPWVVRTAARQAAQWRDRAPPDFRISVNLSAQQFQRGDCVGLLRDALEEHGVEPSRFGIEITESLFIDDQGDARRQLFDMRSLGIHVAIDDFGTGYSSLSYLKRFPVDTLKIDMSFVSGVPHNPEDMALIEAIISMSRALGLDVIAEGVETEAQRDFLVGLGCQYGQGYLFGRSLPAADFAALFLRR